MFDRNIAQLAYGLGMKIVYLASKKVSLIT